jgi:hypothetical protein
MPVFIKQNAVANFATAPLLCINSLSQQDYLEKPNIACFLESYFKERNLERAGA